MTPLPPALKARADELIAAAPPLTDAQKRVIRRLAPRATEAQAAPHAA